ncbi:MAG: hypothetical protein ABUT39_20685 [Acidobacteriota bacterium]
MKRALLLVALAALPASAQQVQVSLTPNEPTVGDRVEAVVALQVDPATLTAEPRFPVWGRTWGEADILATSEPRRTAEPDGSVVYRQRLTLAAFHPGKVALPPMAIAVPLRSRTVQASTPAGLALSLRSVLPKNAKDLKPKAPKPPVPLPIGDAFWWTLAGLLAACLALGLLILRQNRRVGEVEAPRPDLAPFPELAAALDRLAAEPSAVRLHTGLSLAFRHYLARALGFGAEERTTTEIQRGLLAGRLPAPLVRQSVDLLRACDLVKFARQEVDPERSRERLDSARRIGTEIDERTRPAPASDLLEAAG